MIYLQESTRNIYLKQFNKASGSGVGAANGFVPAEQWATLTFAFGENATDVYLDGTAVLHRTDGTLAGSYADCAAAGGYILVGADDSGDDDLFYLSDFRIYEGAFDARGMVRLWAGGPYWAEMNVGADEPWDSGLYFWWGDTVGYRRVGDAWVASDGSSSNFSFEEGNTLTYGKNNATLLDEGWITADGNLAPSHDAARVKWGGDWRMPTFQEMRSLCDNCDWTWTTTNGVSGYVVRGRGEYSAASIFLARGVYWSSVPGSGASFYSSSLDCAHGRGITVSNDRYDGYSVRPVVTGSVAISFDANGGSGAPASEQYMPGMAYGPLPSATREGYTFAGWFTAADGGAQVTAASTVPASTTTLHAHWTANQYAVTFVTGGTGGTESVTATYGSPMPAIAVPTRPGGVFDGYVDGGGTQYYTASGASARNWDIAEATWLFSQWTLIQYAVTLDGQGGTGGTERVTAEYGYPMPTIAVPTRPGYEFRGYYTGADGAGTRYYKASGESARSWDLTDDATLYAKWTVPGAPRGKVQLWEGGPYWAETNVGADDPWDYGLYFWWGDTVGYNYRWENNAWAASDGSASNFSFDKDNAPTLDMDWTDLQSEGWVTSDNGELVLTPAHDAARAHWGGMWRMPTGQELADLINNCNWTWMTTNGVNGYVVRGRGEYSAASIFLPAAGEGYETDCCDVNSRCRYWSSVPEENNLTSSLHLDFEFSNGSPDMWSYRREHGFSVRPVQSGPTGYELWAAANGVAGAWNETDASGIHNVFRYAFDNPSGAFTNPPLLSIHFENGAPVVVTPPLVNTNGYGFALLGYDSLTNAEASLSCRPSPDGTNAITGAVLPARFFRLWAGEGNQVIK